jgi:glycosyltransferase involved in cell wall biosynthesis
LTDVKSPIIIGYCGRFDADKGVTDLIDAVRRVKQQIAQPIVLKLLGVGAYSGSLDSQLAKEAKETDWIKVLPAVPHAEVASFFQKLDIFVLPSRKLKDHEEHDAQALLEALASGIASIGRNSGIIPEIIGDGTGCLVNSECSEELAGVIVQLIRRPNFRRELSQRGRKKAETEFSLAVIAKKKLTIFKRCLNKSK